MCGAKKPHHRIRLRWIAECMSSAPRVRRSIARRHKRPQRYDSYPKTNPAPRAGPKNVMMGTGTGKVEGLTVVDKVGELSLAPARCAPGSSSARNIGDERAGNHLPNWRKSASLTSLRQVVRRDAAKTRVSGRGHRISRPRNCDEALMIWTKSQL